MFLHPEEFPEGTFEKPMAPTMRVSIDPGYTWTPDKSKPWRSLLRGIVVWLRWRWLRLSSRCPYGCPQGPVSDLPLHTDNCPRNPWR